MVNDDERSADDELEATRQNPLSHQVGQNPLDEDNDSPARSLYNPFTRRLPIDHPQTDSELDSSEVYELGINGAISSSMGVFNSPHRLSDAEFDEHQFFI